MKRFIIKLSIYTIFVFVIFIIFAVSVLLVRNFSKFKIDNQISMLVVGHSHPECAFNDSLINKLCNYSYSAEAYFYTFHKTKELISQNPQIQVVFIEFSNIQISKEMDDWTWGDVFFRRQFQLYAPFLEMDEYFMLFRNNNRCFVSTLPSVFMNNIITIIKNFRFDVDGGYLHMVRDKTDSSIIKRLDEKKDKINVIDSTNYELSNINIIYLSKLIYFCKSKNVKPYLIRSPLHEKSKNYDNELIFQTILSTEFSDIEYLDFSKYPLHNSEFWDLEHLNYQGAKRFSVWFNQLINDGLLEKADKQNFITERINMDN